MSKRQPRSDLADVLSEFARTMVTEFPIQGILDHLVRRIVEIMPVTAAGVTLIADGLAPRYVAASNLAALRYEKLQSELGEGPCLASFASGDAVSVPDLRDERRFPEFAPRALDAGLAAVFAFPLYHDSLRLGALDLYRSTTGELSPDAMNAAQTLADVAAAYLINAQARADLQDSFELSRQAALHDALTGLPNRTLMLELLGRALRASRRSDLLSAILFVDLDRFKEVNDTYGHRVGDELLVEVARRLTGLLRPGDSLARFAGDEFVALCEGLSAAVEADVIAARCTDGLSRPFDLSGVEVNVMASIGIAFTRHGVGTPEELLHDADAAMYRTKRERSAAQNAHDAEADAGLVDGNDRLADRLPGAAQRGELHLEYQPIVTLGDGELIGVEALLRWTHPSRGAIAPSVFLPFAERSGQIVEIGQWVLQEAVTQAAHWQHARTQGVAMSVNVSARQFLAAGFATHLAGLLRESATDPGLVILEVTESVLVRDEPRARVVLAELQAIGVQLALDDFAPGRSPVGQLSTLPIDVIKIDRRFIAGVSGQPADRDVVAAVIQLAHGLGMTVVGEGVETAAQQRELVQLKADAGQGFYFARPMPAVQLDALLQQRRQQPSLRLLPPVAGRSGPRAV
jgi:diguanylate cyclase (GGDEF)-like protein